MGFHDIEMPRIPSPECSSDTWDTHSTGAAADQQQGGEEEEVQQQQPQQPGSTDAKVITAARGVQ